MEEGVPAEGRDPPERKPRGEAEREHRKAPRRHTHGLAAQRERSGGEAGASHDRGRKPDRAVQGEHQGHPGEEGRQAPRKGRRGPVEPQRPRDQRSRKQKARSRRDEPEAEPGARRRDQPREPEQRRGREPPRER